MNALTLPGEVHKDQQVEHGLIISIREGVSIEKYDVGFQKFVNPITFDVDTIWIFR